MLFLLGIFCISLCWLCILCNLHKVLLKKAGVSRQEDVSEQACFPVNNEAAQSDFWYKACKETTLASIMLMW